MCIRDRGYTTKAAWELADCLNLEAIRLSAKSLRGAVDNDPDGREGMALGQCVTGMAFSNVGLGIAHSMAHTLGAVYDTPHGVALSLIHISQSLFCSAVTMAEAFCAACLPSTQTPDSGRL